MTKPPFSIAAAAFVSSFDRFAVSPLLVLIATDLGATLTQSLSVASLYYLAYGFSQPLWGVLSDRFGRVRLMRLALIAAAIAGLASALAPGLVTLIIARAFAGAFFGAIVPTALTYVGDTVAEKHRQPVLADLMAAIAIGTALATAASGLIADWLDWRIVFAVPTVLAVICCFGLNGLQEIRSGTVAECFGPCGRRSATAGFCSLWAWPSSRAPRCSVCSHCWRRRCRRRESVPDQPVWRQLPMDSESSSPAVWSDSCPRG